MRVLLLFLLGVIKSLEVYNISSVFFFFPCVFSFFLWVFFLEGCQVDGFALVFFFLFVFCTTRSVGNSWG